MKTVIIWDECGIEPIRFAVIDGDLRKLEGHYINSTETPDEIADRIKEVIYENPELELTKNFPYQAVKDGAFVVVCGFLP